MALFVVLAFCTSLQIGAANLRAHREARERHDRGFRQGFQAVDGNFAERGGGGRRSSLRGGGRAAEEQQDQNRAAEKIALNGASKPHEFILTENGLVEKMAGGDSGRGGTSYSTVTDLARLRG